MFPDSGKDGSGLGSRSDSRTGSGSSNGSSSTSSSSSGSSSSTEEDEPVMLAKLKNAMRQVKAEHLAEPARTQKRKPHFKIQTKGRPPLALPPRQTRHEKHKASDANAHSLVIPEEFL